MAEVINPGLELAARSKTMVREFIVDVLGSLVPGIAFLVWIVPAFVLPVGASLLGLFASISWRLPASSGRPPSLATMVGILLLIVLAFLVFAYIAGHLFYRQDPKVADEASFNRIPRHIHHDGMVRPTDGGKIPVEFPYHFLKQYLVDRGISYLADRVPWDGVENQRLAKHFANALKIRVQLAAPANFPLLARNEAHVRLSSSMWYVCRVLLWASLAGAVIYVAAVVATHLTALPDMRFSPIIVGPAVTALLAWLAKWAIERALHYQREREVLFILETAHWLCISGAAPRMFEGLEPQKSEPPAA